MGRENNGKFKRGEPVLDIDRPACIYCNGFMKSKGKRWLCIECGYNPWKETKRGTLVQSGVAKFEASYGFDLDKATEHARKCEKGQRLIVTSGQNNSEVFREFLESLKQAAKFYSCELAVMPSHYRNDSTWNMGDDKEFAPSLQRHLVHTDMEFGNVILRPDARIRPTTLNPLAGKQAHSGRHWLVFAHPQLARQPIATVGDGMPKVLFTTGSVTLPNYTLRDAGYKAEFHHCQAALILEKCGDDVFVRQLAADDKGHVHDLDMRFTPHGYTSGHKAVAITPGDEHVKFNIVEKELYGKGGLVDLLKPEYIVRHDVLDGYAGSHHHLKDPLKQFEKHHKGDNDYRAEVEQAIDFINRTTPKYATSLIVPSNHHDHLAQFLNNVDMKKDHTNALFMLELEKARREAVLAGENQDPFYLYSKDKIKCKAKWLDRNQPYLIDGIETAQHGDVGANGSRGSAANYAKLPDRMTVGHSHQAIIHQGVYSCGTSTGRLEYQRGASSHSTSVVVQYKKGKRTIIDIINGRYCAKRPKNKGDNRT